MRLAAALLGMLASGAAHGAPIVYPETARVDLVEPFFGERVSDPYRWLEADVRVDKRVAEWVAAQNRVTDAYLAELPMRGHFRARLEALFDYPRMGTPSVAGGRYFYTRNTGLQAQSTLWVRDGLGGKERLLIDPNGWTTDGSSALAEWSASDDGRYVAYAVQDNGSDWRTIRVLDVATGKPLGDAVRWVKFSRIAWKPDGSGFFYSRFPEPRPGETFQAANQNQAVWFHATGTDQSADRLVFATPDKPKLDHSARVTEDGRWLVIASTSGTDPRNAITLVRLDRAGAKPRALIGKISDDWDLVGSIGDRLWFRTDHKAPTGRIVRVDLNAPRFAPVEIVAAQRDTIAGASMVGERIVVAYLGDAKSQAALFDLDGKPQAEVRLPGIGTASGFAGQGKGSETFYTFSSFATPPTVYRFDVATNRSEVFFAPRAAFAPADFTTEQVFYRSKDGTEVPMFLVRRRDLPKGPAPTLLYGYGGFNIAQTPSFSAARMAWLEAGGVLAVANIRGGSEYGRAWHDAGRLARKQNVFDDFIAAAEWLVAQGITAPERLAIQGRSNGGLLVGAVVNQRPDLFAVALPKVGVMDMLRFDRFTAGRYWIDDYGDPAVEADWRVLRAYSPLHNIRAGARYPAILVNTGDTDDRVVPGHSFKYTAALQASDLGDRPRLIRIATKAGHGDGKPVTQLIEEAADEWAFAAKWTGMTPSK